MDVFNPTTKGVITISLTLTFTTGMGVFNMATAIGRTIMLTKVTTTVCFPSTSWFKVAGGLGGDLVAGFDGGLGSILSILLDANSSEDGKDHHGGSHDDGGGEVDEARVCFGHAH